MYNFDYFYGNEAEQYQFLKIPQLLFTDDKFKKLSSDAKVLYGLLLDRSGLSKNNDRFQDENGRTFIYFTYNTAMEMLNCAKEKSSKVFKELDDIGLIERKRQGLGKPTKIYVKHFNRILSSNTADTTELQEVRKLNFKKFENRTPRSSEIELQEVRKSNTNQTNINHTDFNQTDISQTVSMTGSFTDKENHSKTRPTDRHKQKNLNEIVSDIGYKGDIFHAEILNDGTGLSDTMVNNLKECQIPKEYRKDKKALKSALDIFVQWNYAYNGFKEQSDKDLYKLIVDTLFGFMCSENTKFKNETVSYSAVYDSVNRKIHEHGELHSWLVMAMSEWNTVKAKVDIKNPTAYMKMCIWNWLNSDELEMKENYENAAFSDSKKTDNAEKSNSTNTGSGSYSYNTAPFSNENEYIAFLERATASISRKGD